MAAFFGVGLWILPGFMIVFLILLWNPTYICYKELSAIYNDSMSKARNDRERRNLDKEWRIRFPQLFYLPFVLTAFAVLFIMSVFVSLVFYGGLFLS